MRLLALHSQIAAPYPQSSRQARPRTVIRINKNTQIYRPALGCLASLNYRQEPLSKVVRSSTLKERVLNAKDAAFLVSTCITRNLPPVLSLEHGLDKIKEAVEELLADPSPSSTGTYRIQIAVPPSAKALNWFCSQSEKSNVYPIFFLSNDKENPSFKTHSLGRVKGVFGIGSAVTFKGFSPHALELHATSQRYIPAESTFFKAYGFLDLEFDTKMSTVKHQSGSFHLFIPQIELDEYEDVSFLVATLSWDDSSLGTFCEAVQSFSIAFDQARRSSLCVIQSVHSSLSNFGKPEEHRQMVCANALVLDANQSATSSLELGGSLSHWSQFFARLSPTLALARNMHLKEEINQVGSVIDACPNMNSLWASLIVEECTRLGLTYFCIAPGSRSSPLTLAAASHPLVTCISCIDERSLAFHALGYAKGSYKPAVVITSSGTAASNLFPAVVEASQNFVPMLLLTADRPPELMDVGANQAINQVNHYGTFAPNFFSLPPPTDVISARMVLTTIDSAVLKATSSPKGPVHINCPFREPLGKSPRKWNPECSRGLDPWMSNTAPFTKYIPLQQSSTSNNTGENMTEVLSLIQVSNKGILLLSSIPKEDDMWAALLLAKHLQWPVAVDIQSGLRLRKYLSSFLCSKDILFIDQLDQLLLSDSIKAWLRADVVLQIGSWITGRRISQMIEDCFPCSYILVDDHPARHDPSHIVTHRIIGPIIKFCDIAISCCAPGANKNWRETIRALDMVAAWETSLLIISEQSVSEPFVAREIFKTLPCGSAIFFGNSMPIRDADMYGINWTQCTHGTSMLHNSGLECHFVQVAGNRGASGIDGLISTAIGFAVGCKKRVLLVIGDVSFLHDTNGLALLTQRICRKAMVIVVLNNHGGAIFGELPVAKTTDRSIMDQFFYTAHDVSIHKLCLAHGVKHIAVKSKMELEDALLTSQKEGTDCVVEVHGGIDSNAFFHRTLRDFVHQALDNAIHILSNISHLGSSQDDGDCRIAKLEYSLYRVQLNAPPTSASRNSDATTFHREGFVISVTLEDGSVGFGEVAPLEIHRENLVDVEEQLRFLTHSIEGKTINTGLFLLKSSFSTWMWNNLGVLPGSIFPSLRCGLEMAVLSALSNKHGRCLLDIFYPLSQRLPSGSSAVPICALIDSYRSPRETALIAAALVVEGFTTIKIKVARGMDPDEDIAVIQEVRKKVGQHITIRADANRKWAYAEAVRFASAVRNCNLQYIEEPVDNADDIVKFCEETGLPVALDETINYIMENPLQILEKYRHPGIVALVLKPSAVGGFENTALIARWAHQQGKMAVLSAAFESSLGLSAYIQFARFLDLQYAEIRGLMNEEPVLSAVHGFGTYKWFKEELTTEKLSIQHNSAHGSVEADALEAGKFLQNFQINPLVVLRSFIPDRVKEYSLSVGTEAASFSLRVLEVGENINGNLLLFIHGFLGSSDDWIPIMKAMSCSTRCVAIDLPGHGGSKLQHPSDISPNFSMEVMSDMLCKVLSELTPRKVTLVGYSMGARISLYTAITHSSKVERAVLISGSPGLNDNDARTLRRAKDDFRAGLLVSNGLECFTQSWYAEELWDSFRSHPHFKQIVEKRVQHEDLHTLGSVLMDLSIGRQPSLWEDLVHCKVHLEFIVGEKDFKFKKIAQAMRKQILQNDGEATATCSPKVVEIPSAGHAVHIENPLALIAALRQFILGQ